MSSGNMNTGFTRLCKGIAVVLVGGYTVVQIVPSALSYLALIPAKTIPFAWNLITAGYVEQSIYGVVVSTVGLLFIGKLLQPIWGSKGFLMFIFIVNFLTAVCVFVTALSLYYVTRDESYLYLPISGFQGVLYGLLVGVKQIMPDQQLPFLKLRAKWLPTLALLLSIAIISLFTVDSVSYLPTLVFGTYIGWIYLRYWQRKPETKLKGDPSDEFAFSTFFPEFLRPVIDPIAAIFDRMLCGKRSEASNEETGYTLGVALLPGSDPIEASRRRERGARALEERLAAERLAAGAKAEESQRDNNVAIRLASDNV
ncbi:PREDICTED: rhomboid-like protein 19 [Ipomoea nil]|uniref:rhomboid-like protein 19 n=1 Tax=Ipomoea nil TaxID=35883 RepID=UPI000901DE8B|nr:PREDICTED: rhomboid-like protein 19 [Ipomoea nil]XP_019193224.1 PREDICTED: rhomboid-like protein 19 [Ipomoea nil]